MKNYFFNIVPLQTYMRKFEVGSLSFPTKMNSLIPPKVKGGGRIKILYKDQAGRHVLHASVTFFFSHTSEARGLKFGIHNPKIDGSKVTDQIFDILPRS